MDGYPVVEISGEMLRSVDIGLVDFDRSMCDAASRVLNHVEVCRVLAGNNSVPGCVLVSHFCGQFHVPRYFYLFS